MVRRRAGWEVGPFDYFILHAVMRSTHIGQGLRPAQRSGLGVY